MTEQSLKAVIQKPSRYECERNTGSRGGRLTGLALIFVLAAPAAWAQTGEEALETIVVTADRAAESLKEVTRAMTVIGEEEIRNSNATTLLDLLKKKGIQVSHRNSANYGNNEVTIRGASTSYHGIVMSGDILILIDGRPAGADSLVSYSLQNAARVEIVRGPGSVQYGSSAVGGVINIISRRGGPQLKAFLETGIGSWDGFQTKAGLSGQKGDFDFAGTFSYYSSGDYDTGGGSPVRRENSGVDGASAFSANLGYAPNQDNHIGLLAQSYRAEGRGGGSETNRPRQDNGNYMADLLYEGEAPEAGLAWRARYYTGRYDYEIDYYRTTAPRIYNEFSNYTNKYQGAQGQLSWSGDPLKLTGGLDWLRYGVDQNQPPSGTTTAANANFTHSVYDNLGAFLLGKLLFLDERLIFSGGLRFDHFSIDAQTRRGPGTASAANTDKSTRLDRWTPALGLAALPFDWLKLRANWGQSFKMPTPRQQGGMFMMATTLYEGNPDLKPERGETWDLGLDIDYRGLNVSAGYFNTSYRDKISNELVATRHQRYINKDEAKIDGLELALSYDLGTAFDLSFSLSPWANYTRLFTYESGDGLYLPYISRNVLGYGLDFNHPGAGLSAGLTFTYYGQVYNTASATQRLSGTEATIVDLSLTKELYRWGDNGRLSLKAKADNLFDTYYDGLTDDLGMPGRSFYLGLRYDY